LAYGFVIEYDKFFNIDERTETKLENLDQLLTFPVVAYLKENGFLGNIGVDEVNHSLFIASKSSNGGTYQACFENLLKQQKTPEELHQMWVDLKDQEACAVFEVIEPIFDPHMIDYDSPRLVLLDVFHRSLSGNKYNYAQLEEWGKKWGFEVKEKAMVFHTPQQLKTFISKATEDLSYRFKGQDVEGFVLEGSNGAQTKLKLPHYAFWKRMRSTSMRMARLICQTPHLDETLLLSPEQEQSLRNSIDEQRLIVKTHKGQGPEAIAALHQIKEVSHRLEQHQKAKSLTEQQLYSEHYPAIEHLMNADAHPLARSFLNWFSQLPRNIHERVNQRNIPKNEPNGWVDILTLRQWFIESKDYDASLLKTPWKDFRFHEEDDEQSDYEDKAAEEGPAQSSKKPKL